MKRPVRSCAAVGVVVALGVFMPREFPATPREEVRRAVPVRVAQPARVAQTESAPPQKKAAFALFLGLWHGGR